MNSKKIPFWIFSLSTFGSLTLIRKIVENSNLTLNNFSDRTIGIAVLESVNIANRSALYIKAILIWISLIVIPLLFYRKLHNLGIKLKISQTDRSVIYNLSTFGIFTTIYHYINGAELIVQLNNIIKFLIIIYIPFAALKVFFNSRFKKRVDTFNNYNVVVAAFIAPLAIFFVKWGIFGGGYIFTKYYYLYYLFIWLLFWVFLLFLVRKTPLKNIEIKLTSFLLALIPLFLTPVSITLLNEFQFAISNINNWPIQLIVKSGVLFLMAMSGYLFKSNNKNLIHFNFAKYVFLPLLIATVSIFNLHKNFASVNNLDTFHHGENLISTQQLFQYGSIPFIDIFPTHGVSYMIGQVLYSLVNGYEAFQPWIWEWLTKTFEIVLLYFVMAKITNSLFAAGSLFFIPLIGIFGGQAMVYGLSTSLPTTYYFAAFLPGLLLTKSLNRNKKSYGLLISCVFLLFWRIDFGIAGLISVLILLALESYRRYGNLISVFTKIKNFVYISPKFRLLLTAVFITVLFIYKSEVIEALIQIMVFVKFQAQSQGLINVISNFSAISLVQYFILPVTATIYIIWYLLQVFTGKRTSTPSYKLLLVYISIFSLIVSVRSIQRQTLAVLGFNPYLFTFLLLTLPIFFSRFKKRLNTAYFLLGVLLLQLTLPNAAMLVKPGHFISLKNWVDKEKRVTVNTTPLDKISGFLNSNLSLDQTFLDLSSTPLLYITTNKQFINYLIPNAYHTSEVIQNISLKKIDDARKRGKLPIVILRQPVEGANNIDGVPNEIRSYRIFEYIYSNYKPAGFVDGYFIWITNGSDIPNHEHLTVNKYWDQNLILGKIPFLWANFDKLNSVNNTEVIHNLTDSPVTINPNEKARLKITSQINKDTGNYIHMRVKSSKAGKMTISYGQNPISLITFDLVAGETNVDYMVRISSQYFWTINKVDEIILSSDTQAIVQNISVRKGD